MKNFYEYISESILSAPKKTLDKTVFNQDTTDDPVLRHSIKQQIGMALQTIERMVPVEKAYVVGSILTKKYDDNSDIDITVEVDKSNVSDEDYERLIASLKSINGKMAADTRHPINYYIALIDSGEDISDRFDGIYNLVKDKWEKKPKDIAFNVEQYVSEFQQKVQGLDLATAQIRRNIIDLNELKSYDKNEVSNIKNLIQSKLYEIEQKMVAMTTTKEELRQLRKMAFGKPMTPAELSKLKTKNALPENVIYKMLEKYYYLDFIAQLDEILGKDEEITTKDVPKIKNALDDFYNVKIKEEISFSDMIALENDWGIYTEGLKKLKEFSGLAEPGERHSRGDSKQEVRRKSRNLAMTNGKNVRKNILRQTAKYRKANADVANLPKMPNIFSARRELLQAKQSKRSFGVWPLNKMQARWISQMYHFKVPDRKDPIKHLSNMPIILWRSPEGFYMLVKNKMFKHARNPYYN